MGALATIERTDGFDAWVTDMRAILADRRDIDWRLADKLREGRDRFPDEPRFQMLEDALAIEGRDARAAIRTAEAFPPALRASDLSFEVHRYLAALPAEQRLETLAKARRERWGVRQARTAATDYRHQHDLLPEPDPERQGVEIIRAWNRCQREGREYAWELIRIAAKRGFALIDEEEVVDA